MEKFTSKTVDRFLDELASSEPVPGGGSGSALGGALAAGLLSMVCNLTIGKKGYEDVQDEMEQVLARSEAIRAELPDLLQADTEVYSQVMSAYRMPRKGAENKAAREAAMEVAFKAATEVPLKIAARCAEIIDLCEAVAPKANKWVVSDAGVGVVLAEASMRGALLSVEINLGSIGDQAYVAAKRQQVEELCGNKAEQKEKVMEIVQGIISK